MLFTEQKIKKFYIYKVEDVFGKIKFKSKKKLDADLLDQLFMAVFHAGGQSNSKIVKGEVAGSGVSYVFSKESPWSDIDKEEELEYAGVKKESSVGEAMTPTPWKTKINIFRVLIIKIMRWIKKMF